MQPIQDLHAKKPGADSLIFNSEKNGLAAANPFCILVLMRRIERPTY